MALITRPVYTVSWSFIDATGSKGSFELYAPAATPMADLLTAADAVNPLVAAITGCALVGRSISLASADPTVFAGAIGSRVENKGLFTFVTNVPSRTRVSVPGILESVLTSEGRVDEDNAAVSAFMTAVTGGIWTDNRGDGITALYGAYQRFRSSSKAMLPAKRNIDADTTAGN